MNEIFAIARNTFKEAVRNRILYIILVFALMLILVSGVVSELTIASSEQIIKSLGFSAISLFGLAIAVFVGVQLVYNELEKKSIYTIVSKPIGRGQFLLGKYFGLLMTVLANVAIMTLFFLFSLHYNAAVNADAGMVQSIVSSVGKAFVSLVYWGGENGYVATQNVVPVVLVITCELIMITAFAVFFSSFTTPTLSMMFTVLTFIAGRLNEDIIEFGQTLLRNARQAGSSVEPFGYHVAMYLAHVVPNFGAFQMAVEQAIYEQTVQIWWLGTIAYGLLYTAGILSLATVIFHQRNFK